MANVAFLRYSRVVMQRPGGPSHDSTFGYFTQKKLGISHHPAYVMSWGKKIMKINVFSRVNATQEAAMSVGRSVSHVTFLKYSLNLHFEGNK